MFRVGLTGGIACGKSRVLRRFAAAGFGTVDLDRVAREVTAPGQPAYDEIVAAFGRSVVTPSGVLDRKMLGAVVFGDPAARATLNGIVHPRVYEVEERIAASTPNARDAVFVTDAALLVESGTHLRFDRLVVAHCAPQEQVRRVMSRDRLDAEAARARIAAQMTIEQKKEFAHYSIDTGGPFSATDDQIDSVVADVSRAASARRPVAMVDERRVAAALEAAPKGPGELTARTLAESARPFPRMELLARAMAPSVTGPWYESVPRQEENEGVAPALVGAVWALSRFDLDEPAIAATAATMARLSDSRPHARGRGCALGLALAHIALGAAVPEAGAHLWDTLVEHASHWGEAPSRRWLVSTLSVSGEVASSTGVGAVVRCLTGQGTRNPGAESVEIVRQLLGRARA